MAPAKHSPEVQKLPSKTASTTSIFTSSSRAQNFAVAQVWQFKVVATCVDFSSASPESTESLETQLLLEMTLCNNLVCTLAKNYPLANTKQEEAAVATQASYKHPGQRLQKLQRI